MDKKKLKIILIISGVVFLLGSVLFVPFGAIGLGLLIAGIVIKAPKNDIPIINNTPEITEATESPYIFLRFKVAGVTFKNGRKTRQAILRAFKWGEQQIETVNFEPYEFEGRPAVYVNINDQTVGNIPADTTQTFLEYEQKYKRDNVHCEVYGGSKLDDGTRTNYGCEVYIRYLKDS